ncbi:MAG TPA: lipase chaperone [Methylibium sp.]
MPRRRSLLLIGSGAAAALAVLLWGLSCGSEPAQAVAHDAAPAVRAALPAAQAALAADRHDPVVFERWLQQKSSLRGTELDGAWGELDVHGRLKPALALRRRFDQLLTLQGEAGLDEIAGYIAHEAGDLLGADGGQQVVAVWQHYLQVKQYRYSTRVDLQDRSSWATALAERQSVRASLLGADWAQAFYAEEDALMQAALQADAQQQQPLIDRSRLDPVALQRLREADQAWSRWQARLAEARQHWAELQADAGTSPPQRQAAMEQWMQPRFDAGEQRRLRALLQLPGA